ncbi:Aryl-alcohol dehydrogenase [Lentilactobacillus parabuchneri]|uniref:Aryl-alcohol dehydrogenase n=1 Tax=Lentilactobacillus parabuchneri DSM 5707 = NBRC 107865 TaxID=1423784 RepID=A0A0R1YR01_9LACO|nr:aryl-alcohol dehydrogenase [Lentilactobacillus parabuchneri DSM 5707 = NBRC 107865]KRN79519.1 aryl-alcohol dehydrogenase [Lentilactobacillus parabuchneri]ORN00217.1 Aryl-alcohol dehydrogenase [Lentilactobacillus parabuchneri]ORN04310.1 Aryl-alcohol dehydrogenase [Lentilactobacillus parabuchneri]ORN08183.1 Aryl-alcohol dehydrogenase [Lentilactobacillus parabuchneri]
MSRQITGAVIEELNAPFKLETLEVDDQPKAHEVLVHIVASGICHSDEAVRNGSAGEYPYPGVVGHEGAGIVEKVGDQVTTVKEGDHVILSYDYDGTCRHCLTGHPSSCVNWAKLNMEGVCPDGSVAFTREDGSPIHNFFNQSSFTTETLVQERNVTVIDKTIDLRKVGPLGCGFVTGSGTVFNGLNPKEGTTIAIVGTGAVGSAALMAAKIKAAQRLFALIFMTHVWKWPRNLVQRIRLIVSTKIGSTRSTKSQMARVSTLPSIQPVFQLLCIKPLLPLLPAATWPQSQLPRRHWNSCHGMRLPLCKSTLTVS